MIRTAALGVLSAALLLGAAVGAPAGVAPAVRNAPDGFGGPLAAHVVARPIDRDLTPTTRALVRVPCAAPGGARTCFAAAR
jgi:hypothetical protein